MKCNVGKTDRIIRIAIGIIALAVAFLGGLEGTLKIIAIIIGVIGLGTGVLKFCALYTLFGMNTCETTNPEENKQA